MSEGASLEPTSRLTAGASVARRWVLGGRVWGAIAVRVVEDDGAGPLLGLWPEAVCKLPADYVATFGDPDPAIRERSLEEVAAGRWRLSDWSWAWTNVLTAMIPGEWFSVSAWSDAESGRFTHWYVNFEEPFRRSAVGVDSNDLVVDLVVGADGERSWKDEDEYLHARRLGSISDETHHHVEVARERAWAMVDAATGPFTRDLDRWRPDPTWQPPTLPQGWDVPEPR